MAKTKVFVSFDAPRDIGLKETLIGQSRLPDSPFSISDVSLPEATDDWQQKARTAIASCDVFLVLHGDHTHQAQGVKREIKMAVDTGRKRYQIRRRGSFPKEITNAGDLYAWHWKNLKKILGTG